MYSTPRNLHAAAVPGAGGDRNPSDNALTRDVVLDVSSIEIGTSTHRGPHPTPQEIQSGLALSPRSKSSGSSDDGLEDGDSSAVETPTSKQKVWKSWHDRVQVTESSSLLARAMKLAGLPPHPFSHPGRRPPPEKIHCISSAEVELPVSFWCCVHKLHLASSLFRACFMPGGDADWLDVETISPRAMPGNTRSVWPGSRRFFISHGHRHDRVYAPDPRLSPPPLVPRRPPRQDAASQSRYGL